MFIDKKYHRQIVYMITCNRYTWWNYRNLEMRNALLLSREDAASRPSDALLLRINYYFQARNTNLIRFDTIPVACKRGVIPKFVETLPSHGQVSCGGHLHARAIPISTSWRVAVDKLTGGCWFMTA